MANLEDEADADNCESIEELLSATRDDEAAMVRRGAAAPATRETP